jgi:hypothetical protein
MSLSKCGLSVPERDEAGKQNPGAIVDGAKELDTLSSKS